MHRHHLAIVGAALQSVNLRFCPKLLEGLEEVATASGIMGDMEPW